VTASRLNNSCHGGGVSSGDCLPADTVEKCRSMSLPAGTAEPVSPALRVYRSVTSQQQAAGTPRFTPGIMYR
jgi:hypothetical protein